MIYNKRINSFSLIATLAAAACLGCLPATRARGDDNNGEVYGTIVSVRGNILEIRPFLRPKNVRVAIDDKTVVVEDSHTTLSSFKPGMRVMSGGPYSKTGGYYPNWVEGAEHPVAWMAEKIDGLKIQNSGDWANTAGTLKSVKPFVVTDDKGADLTLDLSKVRDLWHFNIIDRSSLLIGVKVDAEGPKAADGVIKATDISPTRNFAQFGTMYGTILGVHGKVLDVLPRYQTEPIQVTMVAPCTLQREVRLDPDSVKIGDTVTFWVNLQNQSWQTHKSDDVRAIALLIGNQRYPNSETDGDNAPVFLTGKLALLEPAVQLALPSGKRVTVIIPGQMPVATLKIAALGDLKPGTPAMLILTRNAAGDFETRTVMLDASPWVGYGR